MTLSNTMIQILINSNNKVHYLMLCLCNLGKNHNKSQRWVVVNVLAKRGVVIKNHCNINLTIEK